MSKANITDGHDNQWTCTYFYDNVRAQAEMAVLDVQIAGADIQIAKMMDQRDAQQLRVNDGITALNADIAVFAAGAALQPPDPESPARLTAINAAIAALEQGKLLLFGFTEAVERLHSDKYTMVLRRAALANGAPAEEAGVVLESVDNVDDEHLNETVGTIDIMASRQSRFSALELPQLHRLVRPLYAGAAYNATRDKGAMSVVNMTPAQAAGVAVQMPYAVSANPRWITGIITALDHAAGTADVSCYGNTPTALTPRGFKQPMTFSAVPVQYMQCGSHAFKVQDYVVLEFAAPGRTSPVVVGFVKNARKCPRFNGWKMAGGGYVHSDYDNALGWTWNPGSGVGGNTSWTGWGTGGGGSKTVSWNGLRGKHFGAWTGGTTAWMDGVAYNFAQPVFGACANREKVGGSNYWFIYAFCRAQTVGGLEYLYKVRADGVGGTQMVWSGALPTGAAGSSATYRPQNPADDKHSVFFSQDASQAVAMVTKTNNGTLSWIRHLTRAAPGGSFELCGDVIAAEFVDNAVQYASFKSTVQDSWEDPPDGSGEDVVVMVADGTWRFEVGTAVVASGSEAGRNAYPSAIDGGENSFAATSTRLICFHVDVSAGVASWFGLASVHSLVAAETVDVSHTSTCHVCNALVASTSSTQTGLNRFTTYGYASGAAFVGAFTDTQVTDGTAVGAYGPDGKYIYYHGTPAWIGDERVSMNNLNSSGWAFKSNDVSQVAFEIASGAALPYGVLGVI